MANTPITADQDPVETKEWLEAYESVLQHEGVDRAAYLLNQLEVFCRLFNCEYQNSCRYKKSKCSCSS